MVWLAIPFSYIGITTVIAVIPALARTLDMSTAQAGLFCSIWMFVRLATFVALWQWTGWHYRFRWLLGAFAGLTASFSLLLLTHNLGLLVAAQTVFGVSVGLIYYSSLFYSMDVGQTKGEHGGVHEAMIGMGICLGPAVGALSLYLGPVLPRRRLYRHGAAGLWTSRFDRPPPAAGGVNLSLMTIPFAFRVKKRLPMPHSQRRANAGRRGPSPPTNRLPKGGGPVWASRQRPCMNKARTHRRRFGSCPR